MSTLDLFAEPEPQRPDMWRWMQSLSPEERVWFDAMLARCRIDFMTDRQAELDRICRARASGLEIIDETTHHPRKATRRAWFRLIEADEKKHYAHYARLMRENLVRHLSRVDGRERPVFRIAIEPKTVQEMGAYARKKASTTGPRRAMTEAEISLIHRLSACRFSLGSWDKRFVRDMQHEASEVVPLITEPQTAQLHRLAHRYRRQLAASVSAPAGEAPPATASPL